MRQLSKICFAAMSLLVVSQVNAEIFPVYQDTYSSGGYVTKGTGAAASLLVGPTQTAFVEFSLTNLSFTAGEVTGARLIFFLENVPVAGSLNIQANTSAFSEIPDVRTAAPSVSSNIISTVAVEPSSRHTFVVVDVTAQVQQWLNGGTNYGFAIVSTNGARAVLGAKEGPAAGYPALLEIDSAVATPTNATFAGTVTASNFVGAGTGLTGLSASQLTNGTLPASQLPTNVALLNGNATFTGSVTASNFIGKGAGLTSLNATQLTNGPLAASLLPSNVALLNASQVFTAQNAFLSNVSIATSNFDRPLTVEGVHSNGEWISLQASNATVWHLNNISNGLNFAQTGIADFRLFLSTNGNVGINTNSPASPLTVNGAVQFGSGGGIYAAGGSEALRIVRGTVSSIGGIVAGIGFTVPSHPNPGAYTIAFNTPFSAPPSISVTGVESPALAGASITTSNFNVQIVAFPNGSGINGDFNFIAIGPQ
jgi:hypothetical protein